MTKQMLDLRAEFPNNPIEAIFLDTFYIPGYRIFEGQRTLITGEQHINKPILNALRILGKLGKKQLAVTGKGDRSVEVLATATENNSYLIMVVNFNEKLDYDRSVSISIRLEGLATGSWRCRHYRIDRDHSNAYTIWQSMGRPLVPDEQQLLAIRKHQGLELMEEFLVTSHDGIAYIETDMPPHSVSLFILSRNQ